MDKILKNYKTTFPAILSVVAVGLFWFDVIDQKQLTVGMAILLSAIGVGAKDHDKK